MDPEPRSITLTLNELLAVLQVMGAPSINGLPLDVLESYSELERAERLNSGVEVLLNRGLFELGGSAEDDTEQLVLDDALIAFVGAAVIPEATLLLTQIQPDGSTVPYYFSATPYIMVRHGSPRAGIFVFTHVPDAAALELQLQTLLAGLLGGGAAEPAFERQVADAMLTRVIEHCRRGARQAALDLLKADAWPDREAQALVDDCRAGLVWSALVAGGLRGDQPAPSDTAIAIRGEQGCWLITQVAGQPATLLVRRAGGRECEAALLALRQPLAQVAGSG